MKPKIAIIYLSFHCEPYIEDVVEAVAGLAYPKESTALVIVDNPHPTHGSSAPYINEHVIPLSGNALPETVLIANKENVGFGKGNNVGVQWAIENGFDYVYFHNADAYLHQDALDPLVQAFESDSTIAIAQSLIALHPKKYTVNSSGNAMHLLGFGYCKDYKKGLADIALPAVKDVSYASGAGLFVSVDFMKQDGGWDNDFFMYHEDMEFSLRARVLGKRAVIVRDSILYHKYEFSRSITKYYWMERNRYGVLLMFYKVPTLLLILPGLIIMEFGLLFSAAQNGWLKEKVKVYKYWLKSDSWKMWLSKRRKIQSMRTIKDNELLKDVVGEVLFQEDEFENPLLRYIANPIFGAYTWFVKKIVVW